MNARRRGASPFSASRSTAAGPISWWVLAWSLQGVAVLLVDSFTLDSAVLRLVLIGALAGLPVLGLYFALAGRGG